MTNQILPEKRGRARWLVNQWPEALRPHGVICDGDTVIVPVWDGSSPASLRLTVTDHVTTIVDVEDGDLLARIFRLIRTDDIECFIDRYGVNVHRDDDDGPDGISVDAQTGIIWRVIALVGFVQAVLDYDCGLQTGRFQMARKVEERDATIRIYAETIGSMQKAKVA